MLAFIAEAFIFLVTVSVTFAVITLCASFMRFHLMTHRLHQAPEEAVSPEDRFQFLVVQALGGLHQAPAPFSILFVEPVVPDDFELQHGVDVLDHMLKEWMQHLAAELRDTDQVVRYKNRQCAVLGRFPRTQAEGVATRLAQSLARASLRYNGLAFRWPARIGMAHYPEHGERAANLLDAAQTALDEIRTQAPGTVHARPVPVASEASPAPEEAAASTRDTSGILDPVTGVLREERLAAALQKVVARQRKEGLGASVIYLSVDEFNHYTGHYGPEAATHVLKGLADILTEHTRETDVLARVGEAEFVVVLDCSPTSGLLAAQRLVAEVRRVPLRYGHIRLKVGISVGVAGHPDHTGNPREMVRCARAAMQAARQRGRGLSLLYEEDMNPQHEEKKPVDVF